MLNFVENLYIYISRKTAKYISFFSQHSLMTFFVRNLINGCIFNNDFKSKLDFIIYRFYFIIEISLFKINFLKSLNMIEYGYGYINFYILDMDMDIKVF